MSIAQQQALADADLCVKCGLCLPHCPTYALDGHEARGPRGRIALAQGLMTGSLQVSAAVAAHLDGCLSCRACEAVCPAKVPYGRVLDAARSVQATPRRARLTRGLSWVLDSALLRGALRLALRCWTSIAPLPRRAATTVSRDRRSSAKPALLDYRPEVQRWRRVPAPTQGEIALFTGCVGDIAERAVLHDSQRLFRAAGVEIAIPSAQACCGALQQHAGLLAAAASRAARNEAAFAGCTTVLPLATGCGAALRDLGHGGTPALADRVQDLCTVLAARLDQQAPAFDALPLRVGIHVACTQANVFGARHAVRHLLSRIPQITLVELGVAGSCCGAAGTSFISQPGQAARLLQPKLDAARGLDLIVSANIGCSMHLLAGLRARGQAVPVLHPVSLLARALAS